MVYLTPLIQINKYLLIIMHDDHDAILCTEDEDKLENLYPLKVIVLWSLKIYK